MRGCGCSGLAQQDVKGETVNTKQLEEQAAWGSEADDSVVTGGGHLSRAKRLAWQRRPVAWPCQRGEGRLRCSGADPDASGNEGVARKNEQIEIPSVKQNAAIAGNEKDRLHLHEL